MNYHSLVETVRQSRTARVLSWSVFIALITAQLIFALPSVWTSHSAEIAARLGAERALLQAALRYTAQGVLQDPSPLTNHSLTGVTIVDTDGTVLLEYGSAPPTDAFSAEQLPEPGADGIQTVSRMSGTVDAIWHLEVAGSRLDVAARVRIGDIHVNAVLRALRMIAFSMVTGALAAVVTLMGAQRFYVGPLNALKAAMQARRQQEKGGGEIAEPVDFDTNPDLAPLAVEFNNLIEEQRQAARQVKVKQQYLEFAAHHDPLTHLPNRLMFENALKRTVQSAILETQRFAVFLIDLDNFKFFNDQYGHVVGDKMVAEVGNRLRKMMRENDLVARLDGDEFVVIQRNVQNRESAEDVARRLMATATQPYEYRGFTLKAAVSVGISLFPDDVHLKENRELLGEEIVNNAAVALQEAKANGKNQHQVFTESMRRRLTERIRLEQDLKVALQEGQFEVYYQPKIHVATRQVVGAEALVRWRHPTNGFISPEVFVPAAEEGGVIIDLGEWILRTACNDTYALQEMGFAGLTVAVNISAVQFADGNLLPMIGEALKDSSLEPQLLELEITESAVMHDPEDVVRSLHELSRFGMKLAIDDFGTGYSSLAYLKRFPVDTLKIDRAFITDISIDSDDVAIVEAVLGLGKHFNMKVLAEGVEDEDQLRFLQAQGCDQAQGYFIGKPMNLEDYIEWLRRWPYGIQGDETAIELALAAGAGMPR